MRGLLATIGFAMLLALLAPHAQAGNGRIDGQQVTKVTVQGPVGSERSVTTLCPRGKTAIWGGWRTGNLNPGQGALQIVESRRSGTRGWLVTARVAVVEHPHRFQVVAYCVSGRAYRTVTSSSTVTAGGPAGIEHDETASCPGSTRAVSGGFRLTRASSPAAVLLGSFRTGKGRRWSTVVGGSYGGSTELSVKTIAYCGARRPTLVRALRVVQRSDEYSIGGIPTPSCPNAPLSTGFRVVRLEPLGGDDAQFVTNLSRRSITSGEVNVLLLGPTEVELNLFNYCR
jgi:hypothetical protein